MLQSMGSQRVGHDLVTKQQSGERSQSAKANDCLIPTMRLSRKGKAMETIKRRVTSRG